MMQGHVQDGDPIAIWELSVDVIFLFDMYLNFRTAYYDRLGQLQVHCRCIACCYPTQAQLRPQ